MIQNTENDAELMQQFRCGGKEADAAFSKVYAQYSGVIFNYCRRMLSKQSRSFPEDVFQQVFISFFSAITKPGSDIRSLKAFLLTTARNLCYNELSRVRIPDFNIDDLQIEAPREMQYEQRELLSLIYAGIERLPDEYKELIVLREQLGLSYDEICTICHISNATARQRSSRARIMLRELLAPYINELSAQTSDEAGAGKEQKSDADSVAPKSTNETTKRKRGSE